MESLTRFGEELARLDLAALTATAVIVIALTLLWFAIILPFQLSRLSHELRRGMERITLAEQARRREATLEAVRRFESDTEVRDAVRHLWSRTEQGTDFSLLTEEDRFHVVTLLNYFDGIASGIKQGVLDDKVARDYLHGVIHKVVKALLRGEGGPGWKGGPTLVEPENYRNLINLQSRWGLEESQSIIEMLR